MNLIQRIKNLFLPFNKMSDGYHTFEELYNHRVALFIELCKAYPDKSWYSYYHSDGTEAFGYPWVIMGINTKPGSQITYHLDKSKYGYFDNVERQIKRVEFAPTFDHHSSHDVLQRLKTEAYKN